MSQGGALPVVPGGIPPEVAYVRLPRTSAVFEARAIRLRSLAENHAAADWLGALARLCDAQHAAATSFADAARGARAPTGIPLRGIAWADATWSSVLSRILARMSEVSLPAAARDAIARLRSAGRPTWESWSRGLLGEGEGPDSAVAPFLAAALQVRFAQLAESLEAASIARTESDCPVCAAPAVAGVVLGDERVRYLSCSLCTSAWHRVRVQCSTCGSPADVSYYAIDGQEGDGVKAEACEDCQTYVKLFYEEGRRGVEPAADDAATLALDLLMGEEGFSRGGVNWLVASTAI